MLNMYCIGDLDCFPINLLVVTVLQLQGSHAEDLNRNPVLMSIGAIFLVWLTFGFSVWYAFYATLVAGIAGGLSLLTGNASSSHCLFVSRQVSCSC